MYSASDAAEFCERLPGEIPLVGLFESVEVQGEHSKGQKCRGPNAAPLVALVIQCLQPAVGDD